jgi:hypothetical protein
MTTPNSDSAALNAQLANVSAQVNSGAISIEENAAQPLLNWLGDWERELHSQLQGDLNWSADGKMGKTLAAGKMTEYNNNVLQDDHGIQAGHKQDLALIKETRAAILKSIDNYKRADAQAAEDFNRTMHQD